MSTARWIYLIKKTGVILFCASLLGEVMAETITLHPLKRAPVLDGEGNDWLDVPGALIGLKKNKLDAETMPRDILVKGGVYDGYVNFYFEWDDTTHDIEHKPWVWDAKKNKYVTGPQREDRLALQFAIDGDYTTDWFSGREFTADMWHWKSSRSNPLGLAHDKSTVVSKRKLLRAYSGATHDGKPLYIARPSDSGEKLYTSKRYHQYKSEKVPKYKLNSTPSGSIADVEVNGKWKDGKWHLELRRKLYTGHPDDVVFTAGQMVNGGIAVFDHSANHDHIISDTLTFQF